MLHVLQYFEGTSMAVLDDRIDLINVHVVKEGPNAKGSSECFKRGNEWIFRGNILSPNLVAHS